MSDDDEHQGTTVLLLTRRRAPDAAEAYVLREFVEALRGGRRWPGLGPVPPDLALQAGVALDLAASARVLAQR